MSVVMEVGVLIVMMVVMVGWLVMIEEIGGDE